MRILLVLMFLLTAVAGYSKTIVLSEKNTMSFNRQFTMEYIAKKQVELFEKIEKLKKTEPLYIVFHSPGGDIEAGMRFIDTIKASGHPVHTITIYAASMAYITVQLLGKRYILPSGTLMSHRASIGGLGGEINGEAQTRLDYITKMVNNISKQVAKRLGISLKKYQKLIADEYWTYGENAVTEGHADEMIYAKCDKSLRGTYQVEMSGFFNRYNVTFSKCPLITVPLKIEKIKR